LVGVLGEVAKSIGGGILQIVESDPDKSVVETDVQGGLPG